MPIEQRRPVAATERVLRRDVLQFKQMLVKQVAQMGTSPSSDIDHHPIVWPGQLIYSNKCLGAALPPSNEYYDLTLTNTYTCMHIYINIYTSVRTTCKRRLIKDIVCILKKDLLYSPHSIGVHAGGRPKPDTDDSVPMTRAAVTIFRIPPISTRRTHSVALSLKFGLGAHPLVRLSVPPSADLTPSRTIIIGRLARSARDTICVSKILPQSAPRYTGDRKKIDEYAIYKPSRSVIGAPLSRGAPRHET